MALPNPSARRFTRRSVELSAEAIDALTALISNEGLTLNTVAHGAFALLLNKQTGENQITYGTTFSRAGRAARPRR